MTLTEKLSREFSSRLRLLLSDEDMDKINTLNGSKEYRTNDVCASQDFCDANAVMAESFVIITGFDVDPNDPQDAKLWNDAWWMAMEQRFYK